jgi:hypothetical protein
MSWASECPSKESCFLDRFDSRQFEIGTGISPPSTIDITVRLKQRARGSTCLVSLTVFDPSGSTVIDHEPLDVDPRHFELQPETGLWSTQVEASASCTDPQEYEMVLQATTTLGLPPTPQLAGLALLVALGTLARALKRRSAGLKDSPRTRLGAHSSS